MKGGVHSSSDIIRLDSLALHHSANHFLSWYNMVINSVVRDHPGPRVVHGDIARASAAAHL
jgi:hypothetical protein